MGQPPRGASRPWAAAWRGVGALPKCHETVRTRFPLPSHALLLGGSPRSGPGCTRHARPNPPRGSPLAACTDVLPRPAPARAARPRALALSLCNGTWTAYEPAPAGRFPCRRARPDFPPSHETLRPPVKRAAQEPAMQLPGAAPSAGTAASLAPLPSGRRAPNPVTQRGPAGVTLLAVGAPPTPSFDISPCSRPTTALPPRPPPCTIHAPLTAPSPPAIPA
jgi:hypothetical protein